MDKFENIMGSIKRLDKKEKLRLGLGVFSSTAVSLDYKKHECFRLIEDELKRVDNTYVMRFYGLYSNKNLMMILALISELSRAEQNRVAMYLMSSVG